MSPLQPFFFRGSPRIDAADEETFSLALAHLPIELLGIPLLQEPLFECVDDVMIPGVWSEITEFSGVFLKIVELRRVTKTVVQLVAPFPPHRHRRRDAVGKILAEDV